MPWLAVTGLGASAIGAGLSATSKNKISNNFLENPEYPHSQDARDEWWNKLQDWGNDPNYGAIAPDWSDIWNQTQQKVKQYYDGSPMAPGVQNRVNSALARRGVSDQPAADFIHAQVGAQENQDLGNLSAQQNIAQNQFAEQGRQTWLNSLQNFQAQKPGGQWQSTSTNPQNTVGQAISGIGGAVGGLGVSSMNNDWFKNLLNPQQTDPLDAIGYKY